MSDNNLVTIDNKFCKCCHKQKIRTHTPISEANVMNKLGLYRITGSNPVSGCIRPVTGYPAGTGYEQKSGRITVPIIFLYELKNNYEKVKTQALFN